MEYGHYQSPDVPEFTVRNGRVTLSTPTLVMGACAVAASTYYMTSSALTTESVSQGNKFAPVLNHHRHGLRSTIVTNAEVGKYDEQVWDMDAKLDVYSAWDPNKPRSPANFNPFEPNRDGNAADASGFFPGDTFYKDPKRGDQNWEIMMKERTIMEEIKGNPKAGDVPGAPGRLDAA